MESISWWQQRQTVCMRCRLAHTWRGIGVHAGPVVNLLQYRPFLRTRGNLKTSASVPLWSNGKRTVCTAATAFLMHMTKHGNSAVTAATTKQATHDMDSVAST
eukprot:1019051-Pelagomonas_calceolata.AAC.8